MPIYCTSFLAVEEDKQQKIARVSIWFWFNCMHCFVRLVLGKFTNRSMEEEIFLSVIVFIKSITECALIHA